MRAMPLFSTNASYRILLYGVSLALCLAPTGCRQTESVAPIVGVWVVTMPEAPFPVHMIAFHADRTVVQSNPDAGHVTSSDSNAMGAWVREGDGFRGKMVEITADRPTHKFVSRGDITFQVKVSGDGLYGTGSAMFYDAAEHAVQGPINVTMQGKRVTP